jgi:hypothetical protein
MQIRYRHMATNAAKSVNNSNPNKRNQHKPNSPELAKKQGVSAGNIVVAGSVGYQLLSSVGGVLLGLVGVGAGIYVTLSDDVEVTTIHGTISSVTSGGNEGCTSEVVHNKEGQSNVLWKCDVVVTYMDGGEVKEYSFNGSNKYIKNTPLELHKRVDSGFVTHEDPNAWKQIGWYAIVIGTLILISSAFWIYSCSREKGTTLHGLCAFMGATSAMRNVIKPTR